MEFPNKEKQKEYRSKAKEILEKNEIKLNMDPDLFTMKGTNKAIVYTQEYSKLSSAAEREAVKELTEAGILEEKKPKLGYKRLAFIFDM